MPARLAKAAALSFGITSSRAWIFLTQPLPHHHTVLFQDGRAARENPSGTCHLPRFPLSLSLPLCPLKLTARGGQAGIDLIKLNDAWSFIYSLRRPSRQRRQVMPTPRMIEYLQNLIFNCIVKVVIDVMSGLAR